jgi:hypothetical protein
VHIGVFVKSTIGGYMIEKIKKEIIGMLVDMNKSRDAMKSFMDDGKGKDANSVLFGMLGVQMETLRMVLKIIRKIESEG